MRGGRLKHAIPDRKELVVVFLHRKGTVQAGEHLGRLVESNSGKGLAAEGIIDRHRKERGPDAVAADVVQVNCQAAIVEPMVTEHVSAKLRGGNESPVGANRSLKFRRQERPDIGRCLREFAR